MCIVHSTLWDATKLYTKRKPLYSKIIYSKGALFDFKWMNLVIPKHPRKLQLLHLLG